MKLLLHRYAVLALILAVAGLGMSGCGSTGGESSSGGSQLTITTATSLPRAVVGQLYNFTLQVSGGTAPYSWSIPIGTGNLPDGMSLSTGGVISGTPIFDNACADLTPMFQVRDARGATASERIELLCWAPLSFSQGTNFAQGNIGIFYSSGVTPIGGVKPYNFVLAGGSPPLPAGLTLASQSSLALIQGTPTVSGTTTIQVQVVDSDSPPSKVTQAFNINILNNLIITTQSLPRGVVNKNYQGALQALGGVKPYSWSANPIGLLGPGLQLDTVTGVVNGTPTQAATFQPFITVTDSSSPPQTYTSSVPYEIEPTLAFIQASFPDGVMNKSYSQPIVTGGLDPYVVKIVSGTLPQGIALSGSGTSSSILQGTPASIGISTFTLAVQDSESPPAGLQQDFAIRVNAQLQVQSATALPNGLTGVPYSFQIQATGGLPPLSWTSLTQAFPSGLNVDSMTGLITGTPLGPTNTTLTIFIADSSNPPQRVAFSPTFRVLGKLRVTTSQLPSISANSPVQMQLGVSGGVGQYTWTLNSGNLPSGLSIDPATGTISGQATQTGIFQFTVQVGDQGPPAQTSSPVTYELTVGPTLGRNDSIANATPLSDGIYRASISPFSDPPNGVGNPDSDYYRLTGIPGAIVTIDGWAARLIPPSPLEFVLEIVDAAGKRLSGCATGSTPSGPYNQLCLSVANSNTNTSDPTLLVQVPNSSTGPMTFYAHALDYRGDARPDMVYELHIGTSFAPLNIYPTSINAGAVRGVNYQQQFSTTGGAGGITWSTLGILPPGWTLSNSGLLAGTATTNGKYQFSVVATDQSNPPQTALNQFVVQVADPVGITSPAQWPDACVNQAYSFSAQATGGVPPYTWGFSSPAWIAINLNQATGTFSGMTNVTGTFYGRLSVIDSLNPPNGQTQDITLNVVACP